jgi:MATE family, multidrug efflux pump
VPATATKITERLRSPHDREIVRLALPALATLAVEPLYVLVDTAVVGHLGTPQIAGLGIAAAVLTGTFGLFNFLAFSTTPQVARLEGAGRPAEARALAPQALWLAVGLGVALLLLVELLAGPLVSAMGGSGRAGHFALVYLRIAAVGLPFALVALAGQGYLRGIADLRTPLVVVLWGNVANLVLELVLVYGAGLGIAGSAAGTAVAQAGMGAVFAARLLRASRERRPRPAAIRRLARVGGQIFVRTASLLAAFTLASAIAARLGDAPLGAHQIAFQLWVFLALVLDAIAVAAQVIVPRALGAGDTETAVAASARMILLSTLAGLALAVLLFALEPVLPLVFTSDDRVLDRVHEIWPVFAGMQVATGAAFALDGILIGAGDSRFLMWAMLAAAAGFATLALLALELSWGLLGVWLAILGFVGLRVGLTGARFAGGRWAVTGAR